MKRKHQLIKLKTETVQDLKRLLVQSGKGSLDNLIASMIKYMDTHRKKLKNCGRYIIEDGDHGVMYKNAA